MLTWAIIFFVVSLVAGAFSFARVSTASAGIAKLLFAIALVIFLIFLALAVLGGEIIV